MLSYQNRYRSIICNLLLLMIPAISGIVYYVWKTTTKRKIIKVGLLHSITGPMSTYENSSVDHELIAIDEINEQGGLLGCLLEPVIADGMSDPEVFATEAERLITKEKVAIIIGCWTPGSRKAVKTVVEKHNMLLVYPMPNEGLEKSTNITYVGASATQEPLVGAAWAIATLGKKVFLIGTDSLYSYVAHDLIKELIKTRGATLAGEIFIPMTSKHLQPVVDQIKNTHPDIIINSMVGDTNKLFFEELRKNGITAEQIPTISFSFGESDFEFIGLKNIIGTYIVGSYLQSIASDANKAYLNRVYKKYGFAKTVSEFDQDSYISVHVWANAVKETGTTDINTLKKILVTGSISFAAPEGATFSDDDTSYFWKMMRVGKINKDGQCTIAWESGLPLDSDPYPDYRSEKEWETFLTNIYHKLGNRWETKNK